MAVRVFQSPKQPVRTPEGGARIRVTHWRFGLIAGLLATHAALLAWGAWQHSPGFCELAHLPAGISHWKFGRFELYRVNPPLVRVIAAMPVLAVGSKMDSESSLDVPGGRPEFEIGEDFIASNGKRGFWLLTLARWATIPISLLGGYVCWCWARELHGAGCSAGRIGNQCDGLGSEFAGLTALVLYCFCPEILAYGQMITPDCAAAALGVAAGYLFWRWLREPNWSFALAAGAVLGLAELTKSSWLILIPLWPALWLVWRLIARDLRQAQPANSNLDSPPFAGAARRESAADPILPRSESERSPLQIAATDQSSASAASQRQERFTLAERSRQRRSWMSQAMQLVTMLLVALYLLNLGYGFEGTGRRLGTFTFVSRALKGPDSTVATSNRFAGSWLGKLPVPLPSNYVRGVDEQKRDLEHFPWPSYLRGEIREHGWWYFYLYALVVKMPVGFWGLFALALLLPRDQRGKSRARDSFVLLSPAITLLGLVSWQNAFTIHFRYVLPMLPFVFIWISRAVPAAFRKGRVYSGIAVTSLTLFVSSSLWTYPHSLSYFNEIVGGPHAGPSHMVYSAHDWGQDLLYLKHWLDEHPEARPLKLACYAYFDPKYAGIDWTLPATRDALRAPVDSDTASGLGSPLPAPVGNKLGPGWYAVSTTLLRGLPWRSPENAYTYFQQFEPVATAGYSIYIYRLTEEDCWAVQRSFSPGDR
ncbi:ArnT family glycosyltransferase [Schlesneria paludicola]|uniref:ArnT family glycosyltransferase n=1 Tax=Schlesneria paludicola TaxID=360056 RepID=UPI00029A54F5|nr:glycosyltransferase family 39 protein [Schlesneria paludicola]